MLFYNKLSNYLNNKFFRIFALFALVLLVLSFLFFPNTNPPLVKTYKNSYYGFSISLPASYSTPSSTDTYFFLGKRIFVQGDVYEKVPEVNSKLPQGWERVKIGQNEAIKIRTGVSRLAGNIPQEALRYDFSHGKRRLSFLLYSIDNDYTNEKQNGVWELKKEDVALFEKILATLKFKD
jgi:hypothetical protein